MGSYTVFDIETPNQFNNTICQIGLVHSNNGIITELGSLVNPECDFGWRNIGIHNIHPHMVSGKPVFAEIWNEIHTYFDVDLVIGHNVKGVDLTVLAKTLYKYDIFIKPIQYLDTMELFKFVNPKQRYRLNDCCEHYGIVQDHHHDALDDARVTHQLFLKLSDQIGSLTNFIKIFDPEKVNYSSVLK